MPEQEQEGKWEKENPHPKAGVKLSFRDTVSSWAAPELL
jgi:hypothetical protein